MIKRLNFYSKATVEASTFDASFAIISINSPATETTIKGTDNILHLEFLDLEEKDVDEEMILEGIAFNAQHAQRIIDFINTIQADDSINTLIVHCFAGVSRSAAVSLAIFHYLKENNMLVNDFDFPSLMQTHYANTLVISTFDKLLHEKINVPTLQDAQKALEEVLVYIPTMFKPLK